jgi:uncharacterized NAD(P)/FAD-binding protein YdhS
LQKPGGGATVRDMADYDSSKHIQHIAIIGAGFSGALQAINLLRHDGPRATLIERQPAAGRGLAYSTAHPNHLLNVRAANMSALPDDPQHFVRWLSRHHPGLTGFVPRIVYGDYLSQLLAESQPSSAGRLTILKGEAIDVSFAGGCASVVLADGRAVPADTVIMAPGNLPPHEPQALREVRLDGDHYAPDPWVGDLSEGLDSGDTVLIIGSGLTMVDVAVLLEAKGFRGRIIALSRRGLMPHAHADGTMGQLRLRERPPLSPATLLGFVRARSDLLGWRSAVDELRPFTQDMWLKASPAQRARFLRHLRPWWDIHRHRLAPAVAARVDDMRQQGRLHVIAGKLAAVELGANGAQVTWRPRGHEVSESLHVRRIINCSGPQGDLTRSTEPLLRRLLDRGLIRPDDQHLGIDVSPQAEVIGADGQANPHLLALGPMTRGTFWEIVAVPDIRVQTWSVARRLSNAHWVGGEGL